MTRKENQQECKEAILKTLAYAAIFECSLTAFQVYHQLQTSKKFKRKFFLDELDKLNNKGIVRERNGKYSLPGHRVVKWTERFNNSQKILEQQNKTLKMLGRIPWVKLILVTGSVANSNANKKDDLDILVIAQKNRLWLTRGFSSLLLIALEKFKSKICPNIFMEEEHLEWPAEKHNLYTAHQLIAALPVIQKDETYIKLMRSNKWVLDYFGNTCIFDKKVMENKRQINSKLLKVLETLARIMQQFYMKNKQHAEITTATFIHFNKNDHQTEILKDFEKIQKKIS